MVRFIAAAALALIATPALASERAHTPQQVSDAFMAGCSAQHFHAPA